MPDGTPGLPPAPALRETPLHAAHVALGARLIDFGGWSMPVQYRGILEEHAQVRRSAGLFDLSHMGELWVHGPGAGDGLAWALVNDPRTLAVGRASYSMICAADGGIIDDLIVYRVADDRFLVVPNASNAAVVSAAVRDRLAGFDATLDDASDRTALIAVQGPAVSPDPGAAHGRRPRRFAVLLPGRGARGGRGGVGRPDRLHR